MRVPLPLPSMRRDRMASSLACPTFALERSFTSSIPEGCDNLGHPLGLCRVKAGGRHAKLEQESKDKVYAGRGVLWKWKLASRSTWYFYFRRFFVGHCAEAGIPMAMVIAWVGHDEMGMVMHYYRMRDVFSQKAMRQFSAGFFGPDSSSESGEPTTPQTP